MPSAPSNTKRPRRNDEMKFAYAGPFAPLLNPIRLVKPERGPSGIVLHKQPRYTPYSPESYTVGTQVDVGLLIQVFGREHGSAPKRRRGSRGGRKVPS